MVFKGKVTYRSGKEGSVIPIPSETIIKKSREFDVRNPLQVLHVTTSTRGNTVVEHVYHPGRRQPIDIRTVDPRIVNENTFTIKPSFKDQLKSIKTGHGLIQEIQVIWEEDPSEAK